MVSVSSLVVLWNVWTKGKFIIFYFPTNLLIHFPNRIIPKITKDIALRDMLSRIELTIEDFKIDKNLLHFSPWNAAQDGIFLYSTKTIFIFYLELKKIEMFRSPHDKLECIINFLRSLGNILTTKNKFQHRKKERKKEKE